MIKVVKENLIPLFTLSLIILLTFWNLPRTFYQQDEWQALGHNLIEGINNLTKYSSPIQIILGEGRPLTRALNLLFFGFFKFDLVPIAIFSIIFHTLNTFLVFFLVKRISPKTFLAFFTSLFFAVNSVSHQAVTWAAAAGTLPATTLILLSILTYFRFLEDEEKQWLYFSFGSAILSLFFKETGLFLFVFLPLLSLLFKKKATCKDFLVTHLPLFVYGGLLLTFRMIELFLRTEHVAGFVGGGKNFIGTVIFHLILYPLTSLFQVFVPSLDLYRLTPILTKIQYKFLLGSPFIDLVAQSVVADLAAVMGSAVLLGFLIYAINRTKDEVMKRNILFALSLFFLSFLPYAVLHRESSYLSSRYFYVGGVAGGMIFGYIVIFLADLSKYFKWVILGLVALYLYHHASIIRNDINYQVSLGNQKKAVLLGIKKAYPKLEKDNIFYVTSDKAFYGDITNPFQNGLGYILEVWYYDSGNIPKEFLTENFLWDLGSEGYRKIGERGFGYFQDINKMIQVMKENNLSKNIVHAFYYDSKTGQILDNTQEIQERLATISALRK